MCEEKSPTISVSALLHAQLFRKTVCTIEDFPQRLPVCLISLGPMLKSLLFLSPPDVSETYAKVVSKAAALKVMTPHEQEVGHVKSLCIFCVDVPQ